MSPGDETYIQAKAQPGFEIDGDDDWTFDY
jgi:hypothetical protein